MIRNIIFDIGHVLVGFEWESFVRELFDEETARAVTRAIFESGYWAELDRGVLSEEEVLEGFFSAEPNYHDEILEAYEKVGACVKRRSWVIPWIKSLKQQGYRIFFLSNYSEQLMRKNPEALDFLEHMDGGVFSCDVKLLKPDARIYETLLEKYGLKAEECLFLDDREDNVLAAQRLGMHAIRFQSEDQAKQDIACRIAHQCASAR